jgi:hypothetical protein
MNTFLTVLNAFPAILASVQAVEAAIPLPKVGQQKLNLVLGAATTAWELGSVVEQMNKTNWLTAVEVMTGITVAGLNAAGVFTTTSTGAPATVPATPVSSN